MPAKIMCEIKACTGTMGWHRYNQFSILCYATLTVRTKNQSAPDPPIVIWLLMLWTEREWSHLPLSITLGACKMPERIHIMFSVTMFDVLYTLSCEVNQVVPLVKILPHPPWFRTPLIGSQPPSRTRRGCWWTTLQCQMAVQMHFNFIAGDSHWRCFRDKFSDFLPKHSFCLISSEGSGFSYFPDSSSAFQDSLR